MGLKYEPSPDRHVAGGGDRDRDGPERTPQAPALGLLGRGTVFPVATVKGATSFQRHCSRVRGLRRRA